MEKNIYPRPYFERYSCFIVGEESSFSLPEDFLEDIILLNAEGTGKIEINGKSFEAGEGIDVTDAIIAEGVNGIKRSEGVSDIWLEAVPKIYIKSLTVEPFIKESKLHIYAELSEQCEYTVEIYAGSLTAGIGTSKTRGCDIRLNELCLWSPEEPFLYDAVITAGKDTVKIRFGIKKIDVAAKNGSGIFMLNGKPYFPLGTVCADVSAAKAAGFNMIVLDKPASSGFYAECDKQGIMVWQSADVMPPYNACSAVSGCSKAECVSCGGNEIRLFKLFYGKNNGKAPVFVNGKKSIGAFCRKSQRLMKKGLAGAIFANAEAITDCSCSQMTRSVTDEFNALHK